ncbi:MAG: hypothetical protein KY476_15470 [Planctomycetes bacterium]|nr:hypothetical protein [Planctomycetota bacterium]
MPDLPARPPRTTTFVVAAVAFAAAAFLLAWVLRVLARERLAGVSPWLAHPASIGAAALVLFIVVLIVRSLRRSPRV